MREIGAKLSYVNLEIHAFIRGVYADETCVAFSIVIFVCVHVCGCVYVAINRTIYFDTIELKNQREI